MQFNITPYFDDYDSTNGFYKVLFNPERPIQVRELNTIQSMFNGQVKRFADHMFKNGTKISDARTRIISYKYIETSDAAAALKEGMLLVGATSGQSATFITRIDSKICVEFRGSNSTGAAVGFSQNETVNAFYSNGSLAETFTVINRPIFSGNVQVFVIEKGVFYFNGYFIENKRQILPIQLKDDIDIGFQVVEKIITPFDDPSLLDNNTARMANGQPGADRYAITLELQTRNIAASTAGTVENNNEVRDGFIILASVRNGAVQYILSETEYGSLGDHIAQRTYEESGNYTVRPFGIKIIEHKAIDETDELGLTTDGLEENYVVQLSPSVAYVRGYRVETVGPTNIVVSKARDTEKISGFIKQFESRSYVYATPRTGKSIYPNIPSSVLISDESTILLYDSPLNGSDIPTGTQIGTLKISDMSAYEMTTEITPRRVYKYYVHDVLLNPGSKLSDVQALYHASASFAADTFLSGPVNEFTLFRAGNQESIWEIDKPFVKSLRSYNDPSAGSIACTMRKKFSGVLDGTGSIAFVSPTGQYFKPFNDATICVTTLAGVTEPVGITTDNSSNSPEQITITLGASQSGKTLTIITDVMSVNQAEKTKVTTPQTDLFTDSTQSSYTLPKSDVWGLKVSIYDKSNSSNPNVLDVTSYFKIFNGCGDTAYTNAVLTRTDAPLPTPYDSSIHGFRVEYSYYHHSGNEGYFTVDSYTDTGFKDIPTYKTASGRVYELADCFDFRPLILSGVVQSTASYPSIGGVAIFDIECYLGRVDSVAIRKDGGILVYKGVSSLSPLPPEMEDDHLVLYNLWLSPYTFNLSDIVVRYIDNRRYTMRDIGKIENRLSTVEYYTSLNLLEKSAKDLSVKDVNGLDRFKNGFVVDDFSNFQAADTGNSEFRAAVDPNRAELRPSFRARNFKLNLDRTRSFGGTIIDGVAYLPYNKAITHRQKYATRSLSVNPFFMTVTQGELILNPNVDTWADTTTAPSVTLNIDTGTTDIINTISNANGMGRELGEWKEINRTVLSSHDVSVAVTSVDASRVVTKVGSPITDSRLAGQGLVVGSLVETTTGGVTTTVTTTTTTTGHSIEETRFKDGIEVGSRTDTYSTGSRATGVNLQRFMRPVKIEFLASKMRPNTIVYPFFDGQPVSQFCRPITGNLGDALVTDSSGILTGVFEVPGGLFFVGQKEFKLSGDPTGGNDG